MRILIVGNFHLSWIGFIMLCRPGSVYQAAAMPYDRASLRESAASTGEG